MKYYIISQEDMEKIKAYEYTKSIEGFETCMAVVLSKAKLVDVDSMANRWRMGSCELIDLGVDGTDIKFDYSNKFSQFIGGEK